MKLQKLVIPILGAMFLLLSAQPLFLMGREWYYGNQVNDEIQFEHIYVNSMVLGKVEILGKGTPVPFNRISLENYLSNNGEKLPITSMESYRKLNHDWQSDLIHYARVYKWEGQTIQIEDQFHAGVFGEFSREQASLNITINQNDWSTEAPIDIRPNYVDENRYHGYFGVLDVKEKGTEKFVIIQRISGTAFTTDKNLAWRILRVDPNGQVQEERFTYDQRSENPQRVNMINITTTSPFALGYQSNILMGWPSLFFPLIYPFGTAILGLIFVIIGLVKGVRSTSA
ncbi:hypothetical protein A8709_16845 [Paenibacillus pectinilyticus]|uniref:Uncharacterized protein n=1 Tax=Paenibacillus pectinilyticus TaxID=512399 RepID=A0A1C1A8R4_9BACL|nr:hypothetical protein [Paenibacillus pectinilyticus]OCT16939.1 hypothetical protein A8709_16845 [Paenibacillus pectinilyticus]